MDKNDATNPDVDKLKRIETEKKKLEKQYTKLDSKQKKVVTSLIENASFMIVTLQDLQDSMNKNGVISHYQNGENQWGTKKSPEVDIYNTMIKNHMAIIKQLSDLVPKENKPSENDDGFDGFVSSR